MLRFLCLIMARFYAMITNLSRRQLIIVIKKPSGARSLVTHRCLQRSIWHNLKLRANPQTIFEVAVALLRRVLPRQSPIQYPKRSLWKDMELYSPHVMSLREIYHGSASLFSLSPSIEFAKILGGVANYFWERNLFSQGILACDSAEEICDAFPGQFPKEQADVFTIGASIRFHGGISERSSSLWRMQKSLSLRQQYMNALNPEDATEDDVANYANAWSNLGCALVEHDLFEQAIPYFDLAIAIRDKVGIASRMNTESSAWKSLCLAGLGKMDESMDLIVPDSKIDTWPKKFLNDVLLTLDTIRLYWSTIYLRAGRTEEAHRKMHRIMESRIRCFGPFSRATLDVYYLLAVLERQRQDLSAAEWVDRLRG